MKLHLGSGHTRKDGWTNVDVIDVPGVTDLVCDLDGSGLADALHVDTVTESLGVHFLEHLHHPLEFMAALWQVTEPGGAATFEVPYGSSDDAWEDPTHRRPYFMNSWVYFGQPAYHRADYGYRGDWRVLDVALTVDGARWAGHEAELTYAIKHERNAIKAMTAVLECVKPARSQTDPRDEFPVQVVPA